MVQEIEIEFKNLLTKEEFNLLLNQLPFPKKSKTQTNYYFDTKQYLLRNISCALRIREKDEKYQLTLKEPHDEGVLETHDWITKQDAMSWIKGNVNKQENTAHQLYNKGVHPKQLLYLGNLVTERREFFFNDILYVLDHSMFNGQSDYELEIEAPSHEVGFKVFASLLREYNITKKDTPTKIQRFFSTLK